MVILTPDASERSVAAEFGIDVNYSNLLSAEATCCVRRARVLDASYKKNAVQSLPVALVLIYAKSAVIPVMREAQ